MYKVYQINDTIFVISLRYPNLLITTERKIITILDSLGLDFNCETVYDSDGWNIMGYVTDIKSDENRNYLLLLSTYYPVTFNIEKSVGRIMLKYEATSVMKEFGF